MKQALLDKLANSLMSAFIGGALLSLTVYIFARILFYEFTITAGEEISNFFVIVISGGLMVSVALLVFLLLEMGLQFLCGKGKSSSSFNRVTNIELAEYPMAGVNSAA
jgi:uncharacterized membrane protein